ncbi:MAG: sensor histidine kinase [Crocinitomicaceae bacterium]|nr:sensor histidine kinase [Crocinitomicaceae bacterium]
MIYLLVRKEYKFVFLLYGLVGSVLTHYAINFSMATPHYNDFLWLFVVSFLVFVGLGRIWGLITLAVNALATFYFIFFVHNEHIRVVQPMDTKFAWLAFLELIVVFFVIGFIMHQFLMMQKYSDTKLKKVNFELQTQNELILAKNNENTALVKEVHHRVKNNLQIIISLLRLQQSEMKNQEMQDQFTEAINRIMIMSSIHQRLYAEKELSRVDVKSYVEELARDLNSIYNNTHDVNMNIEITYAFADLKTIVPLGLLLNELISNSLKYAFENTDKSTITIRLLENGEKLFLEYSDNGRWKQKGSDNAGFGLDLIQILTEQLNGTHSFHTDESGTQYTFELNKLG